MLKLPSWAVEPRFITQYPWFHKKKKNADFEEATRLKQILDREDYPVGYAEKVQREQITQIYKEIDLLTTKEESLAALEHIPKKDRR